MKDPIEELIQKSKNVDLKNYNQMLADYNEDSVLEEIQEEYEAANPGSVKKNKNPVLNDRDKFQNLLFGNKKQTSKDTTGKSNYIEEKKFSVKKKNTKITDSPIEAGLKELFDNFDIPINEETELIVSVVSEALKKLGY